MKANHSLLLEFESPRRESRGFVMIIGIIVLIIFAIVHLLTPGKPGNPEKYAVHQTMEKMLDDDDIGELLCAMEEEDI